MRKILSVVLSFGLLFQQSGLVYAVGELNLVNYLSHARSAIVQPDQFRPPQLRYISYDIKSNDFKLLLDKGDFLKGLPSHQVTRSQEKEDKIIQETTQELMRYFFIGLSLPNDKFWVNLRPDAAENIIDPLLEKTDIGKIFLDADLQLKKDTASLTSPQNPEGKLYWDKLYKKAGELFGTENITIPTLTRPWIVPNEVIVRETDDSAYIYKATLKVMLEEDYLKSSRPSAFSNQQYNFNDPRLKELNQYSTQLIRETILPKLTQEVNSSQRYAKLRQVYYSLVLSRWFKMKYKGKPGQYPELIDRQNLTNLASKQAWDKQTYFSQYQESFAKGEYNLKETVASVFGQSIRSYVSGGIVVGSPISEGVVKVSSPAVVTDKLVGDGNILFDKKLRVIKSSAQPAAIAASPITSDEFRKDMEEIRSYLIELDKIQISLPDKISSKEDISELLFQLISRVEKMQSEVSAGNALLSIDDQKNLTVVLDEVASDIRLLILVDPTTDVTVQQQLYNHYSYILDALNTLNQLKKKLNPSSAGSPLAQKQKKMIRDMRDLLKTLGNNIDKDEIISRLSDKISDSVKSVIAEVIEVKKEEVAMDKSINNLTGDYLYTLEIIASLERYSGVYFNEEETEEYSQKTVAAIIENLRKRIEGVYNAVMSDKGNEKIFSVMKTTGLADSDIMLIYLLKQICRTGLDDLLEKAAMTYVPQDIERNIVNDEIGDAAYKLGQMAIKKGDYRLADACNLIWKAWRNITAGSPVTPREILELAKKEINETNREFQYYRVNHYISYYERIDIADPFSKEDVIKKLTNEITALQDVIDKSKQNGSQISDVVSFEALRTKNFFKDLRKKLKNSPNQSAETRNSKVKKSGSPLTVMEARNIINELKMLKNVFSDSDIIVTNVEDLKEELKSLGDSKQKLLKEIIKEYRKEPILNDLNPEYHSLKTRQEWPLELLGIIVQNEEHKMEMDGSKLREYFEGNDDMSNKLQDFIMAIDEFNRKYIAIKIKEKMVEFLRTKNLSINVSDISIEFKTGVFAVARITFKAVPPNVHIFQEFVDEIGGFGDGFRIGGILTAKYEKPNVLVMSLPLSNRIPNLLDFYHFKEEVVSIYERVYGLSKAVFPHKESVLEVLLRINNEIMKGEYSQIKSLGEYLIRVAVPELLKECKAPRNKTETNLIRILEKVIEKTRTLCEENGVSSSLTTIEGASPEIAHSGLKKGFGGIDLTDRMLNMQIERVGSFALSALVLPGINNVEALDLDKEFEQIQAMVSSSIRPSDTRILEFAAACYYKGEFDRRLTQVSSCIKSAHLADELLGKDSSEPLRLATMLPDALYGG